jgi:hypothetical protein
MALKKITVKRLDRSFDALAEFAGTGHLEALVRQANAMASCRSFDDVRAFRAMRTLA